MACCLIVAYLVARAWDALVRCAIFWGLRRPAPGRSPPTFREWLAGKRRQRTVGTPAAPRG